MSVSLEAALEAVNVDPFSLAADANCSGPILSSSPGAEFLIGIRDALVEQVRDSREGDEPIEDTIDRLEGSGVLHEISDGAVPIYTHNLWQVFVDLAAYLEDPTELGCDGSDMDQAARTCLYLIADRLLYALCDRIKEEWNDQSDLLESQEDEYEVDWDAIYDRLHGGEADDEQAEVNQFDGGPLVPGYTSTGAQLLQSVTRNSGQAIVAKLNEETGD